MDAHYSPNHSTPRHAEQSQPAVDALGVDPTELRQLRDELTAHMEQLRIRNDAPPGASALFDHFLEVMDRVLRGTAYRREVELLLDASEEFVKWRQARGPYPTRYVAVRDHTLDVLHRLAATVPQDPPHVADPDEDVAWPIETTMTVEAFAHAIGKSPSTVYRMIHQGQLSVYRDGAGRGTMLIYRDQLDPANRPRSSTPTE